jgi:precorrin-2 dehydrogenase/sirohydrochlorin ferrochelatase
VIPLVLSPAFHIVLAGAGPRLLQRLAYLDAAGAEDVRVHAPAADGPVMLLAGARLRGALPTPDQIAAARLLFVAGLATEDAARLAAAARKFRVWVNVEDVPHLCDFHVPAVLRRGALTLATSTDGTAPGLAGLVRTHLAAVFEEDWARRVERIAELRRRLRARGARPARVTALVARHVSGTRWLDRPASGTSPAATSSVPMVLPAGDTER